MAVRITYLLEDIPTLDLGKEFFDKLIEPKVKLKNCSYGPRDVACTIHIAESTWNNKDNHEALEKLTQKMNEAVTKALQKELKAQVKKQGLNPKDFNIT